MNLLDKLAYVNERLRSFGEGAVPFDTVIDQATSPCEVVIEGRRTLMCGSNNYFGLSFHPNVIRASCDAIERYGSGTTGSRAANGTLRIHRELEHDFASFYGKREALVFTTGYQANLGVIAGLCGPGDSVVVDVESHASIYDGAKLSGAQIFAFRHNSAIDLARKLAKLPRGRSLVVVEGLYSMGGDVSPLVDIVRVCRDASAMLAVDEAHSFGAYGARGLGWAEAQGVLKDVDFVVGTFSKTLAGVGGFCVSDHAALKALHFTARSYVFTASGSPANIAGVRAALAIVRESGDALRARLWENVRRVRKGLKKLGYKIGANESPIVPIQIGAAERTVELWQALLEAGLYVNVVLPPGCRPDACLLRTSYSAAHTDEHIDKALAIFESVGRDLRVIEAAA
jgi:8-amino-7-oxononanoate synthase